MKKALSLILVLVLCLSLCACANQKDPVVGEWEPTDIELSDRTLVFFDSGKGQFVHNEEGWGSDFEWEATDGKVYIMVDNGANIYGLTNMYTISGTSLIHPDGTVAFTKK